ncbi:LamG-like jellyroll fold domain-containing protein [Kitasatospora sp. HPMI-4]|uniref:LamG-like jellyroll fold domain-containing protein n=1 Tax=Kitasatospora sp. HPMI-4 TaxID=3448443 RepID=UPI003F1B991D
MFANTDGTKTVRVYSRPVHFKKSDGSWADIDTTLVQGADGQWQEKANNAGPTFAPKSDAAALTTWQLDASHKISYSLQDVRPVAAHVTQDKVTYPLAAPSADVVYNALANGVKESLVLHDATAPSSWIFPLDLTGLEASVGQHGEVRFTDQAGALRLTIPAGFMEDSAKNPVSGDGAISGGVQYRLIEVGGKQALRMDLDTTWLHDKTRVFPVTVDPTTSANVNVGQSTYVMTGVTANFSSDTVLKAGTYNGGGQVANTYLYFPDVANQVGRNYVVAASVHLATIHSFKCDARPVYVSQIDSSWGPGSISTFPGLSIGQQLGQASFYAGDTCPNGIQMEEIPIGRNPTDPGSQLVNSWSNGGDNHGLAVTTSSSDSNSWKVFDSVNTNYPPYLSVTYSDWAADYSTSGSYTPPTATASGTQQVTLTNLAANWWNSTSMQIKPRFFDANWNEQSIGNDPLTGVPGTVKTGEQVTVNGVIPPLPLGQTYQMCWDGYVNGTTSLHDSYNVPYRNCTWVSAQNIPPQIDSVEPLGNTVVGTLSPQLYATGHDPDNYPGTGLQYQFQIKDGTTVLADSGWVANQSWSVPTGVLAWNKAYTWTVRLFDGLASSPWANDIPLRTAVQQPLVTSRLGGAVGNGTTRNFDAQVGNYTTEATDAMVRAIGPKLGVDRTYNSLDPRTSTLFGSGWSSPYDMSVVPDGDSTGSVVLTTASGRAERFGRNDFQLTQLTGIGDQTGDGVDDAVAVDSSTGQLWLYPGPDFSAANRRLVGSGGWNSMSQLTGADVTGDGIGDLVAVQPSDGTLWLYPGVAGGGFLPRVQIGSGGWNGMSGLTVTPALVAGGSKALVATEVSTGYLFAYPFNSDGSLGSRVQIGTGGWNGMSNLIGGDFNHDGKGDVVAVENGTGKLWLYPGGGSSALGTSTLGDRVQIGTGWNTMRNLAAVGGISGDTGTDLIAVDKATGVQYLYHSAGQWSGPTRTTTAMPLYTSAAGEFETLAAAANGGGWVLADKAANVYTFNQQAGQAYLLSKITDREHHSQILHYTGGKLDTVTDQASNRVLHFTWTSDSHHVASVSTDPATGSDTSTAQTWTYTYNSFNSDQLAKVCSPPMGTDTTTRPCTAYTYASGSHLRSTVLDADPSSYWRLGESTGTTTAASEVIANQGTDKATYSGIGLGTAAGPLMGSATTTATFDGTTSVVTLPNASLRNSYLAIGLWFKTTAPGVLVGYQNSALSGAPSHSSAPLYIGSDGKLRGEFSGPAIGINPITSTTSVTDGAWHFAVLSGAGDNQTLYLDGAAVGTLSGAIDHQDNDFTYLGAGYTRGSTWPAAPAAAADGNNHFSGQLAEAAFYQHALGAPAVASQWTAATTPSSELTAVTLPSGKSKLAVTYDTVKDRASQVTDANGGTWNLNAPSVSGSEQEYRSAVLGSRPAGYWRLSESAASQAANTVAVPRPTPNNGSYSNVTLGGSGPMTGSNGAAGFDGATSWAEIPAAFAPSAGPGAIGVWFKTSSPGVLVSYQSFPIGVPAATGLDWNPALYIGTDGMLHGELWAGTSGKSLVSTTTVTDNKWHFAALSAETPSSQSLYLDGQLAAGPLNAAIHPNGRAHVYIGAGAATGWAAAPTDIAGHFNGQIADVATFNHGIGNKVADLYKQGTTNGAHIYDVAVVDAQPTGYWRLNDAVGNQANELLSSVALSQNQGTYSNVTLGAAGPYASGGSTAASFDGTTSQVQLPATAVPVTGGTASVEVWFKTAGPGVIYGYQSFPLGAAHTGADWWNPALYVGTDGMLHGQLWNGSGANTAVSAKAVNDNTWHMATLVASGSGSSMSQQLYIDGQPSGTPVTGLTRYCGDAYAYLGAGTDNGSPKAPTDISGHFNGQIADFSYYPYAMAASTVASHYTAATAPAGEAVSQSANYRAAVTLTTPSAYWRLDEAAGATTAQDELGTALPNQEHGTYTNTTLGTTGPSGSADGTAVTFNGTTSSVQLPATAAAVAGPNTIELWFKTTTSGTLYGYQSFPLGAAHTNSDFWNPALYVGSDGKLYGDLWTGDASTTLNSSQTVNDGNWHHAVLADDDSGQTLYLDGAQAATSNTARQVYYNGSAYVYVGAGTADGGWPNHPTSTDGHFNGSIAEVASYKTRLTADAVSAHYKAMGSATSPTKITYASVTASGGYVTSWRWDTRTGQLTTAVDLAGETTRYTYDTHGYLYSVTDANGHTITTGHDDRGNTVSTTTCTTAADCHTAYAGYYLDTVNPFNPQNDHLLTSSDARSRDDQDSTYTTSYTYNAAGDLITTHLPATPDFPNGRSSSTTYTTGTETAVGSSGLQPAALPSTSTGLGGQVTHYDYDQAGNLTRTTSPSGLVTTYTYDNLGRNLTQTGNCADCGTGPTTTAYTWDGQGNLLTQTDPSSTDAVTGTVHTRQTRIAYDTDGNQTSQTIADTTGGDASRTITWTYNTTNNLVAKTTDPAGQSISYTYDPFGNVTAKTDAAGTKWFYNWDGVGRPLRTAISNYTGSPTAPVTSRFQLLESRAYDPAGRLATVTDAMGRTTHTYYNDDNSVAEVDLDGYHNTDGSQRNIVEQKNTYDAAGHLTQQVTGGGKTTVTSAYDAAGRLTSGTLDPAGLNRTTSYTYDASGNTLSSVLTDGKDTRETDYTYNPLGQVLTQTMKNQGADTVVKNTYDQRGLPLTTISPLGNVAGADPTAYTTTFTHDALGRLTVTTSPPAASTVFNTSTGTATTLPQSRAIARTGYGIFDNPISSQDPNGNITTFTRTYDSTGQHDSTSQNTYTPPGQSSSITPVTQIDYDPLGQVKTAHDAKGQITTNTYDQLGNLVETDLPPIGGAARKILSTYDLDGELLSVISPTGAQTQSTYDDLGRPATLSQLVRHPAQNTDVFTTNYAYDDAGNKISSTSPTGAVNKVTYNAAGEQTSVTNPLTFTTTTTYNLAGQPIRTALPGNKPGDTGPSNTITYDAAGHVTGTTKLSSTGTTLASTSTTYDVAGNPITATDADGNTTTTTYDALGRPLTHTEPVATGKTITTAFAYDPAGHRTAYTDGNTNTTYYTFNSLGLPESTIEPATPAYPNLADRVFITSYNILGTPVTMAEPGGVTISTTYDEGGRLTQQTGTGGEAPTPSRTFGYDLAGNLTSLSTPTGAQTYTYDDRNQIISANGQAGNATYGYNPDGQLATQTNEAGTTTFTYDPAGQLKLLTDPQTGSTLTYGFTPRGQVSTVQYGNGDTRTLTYDDLDNVTNDALTTTTGATVSSLAYTYYPSGRLKTKTTNGLAGSATHTYTYDQTGRLSTWNNGTATTAYGYDPNGNLTTNGNTTATYNQRNQITSQSTGTTYTYTARGTQSASTTGSTTTNATYNAYDELTSQAGQTYTYDALGRLNQAPGHTFTYDATTNSLTSDGTEKYTRDPGGNLTAIGNGTTGNLAYTDLHGDLIATFTPTSTAPNSSTAYDPWGKPTATTGTTHNLGYQGGWTDSTTGQVSTASRWYNPGTANFTSRDTANLAPDSSVTANRYAYASDDPLSYADPSGHSSCWTVPPVHFRGSGGGSNDDDDDSGYDDSPTPVHTSTPSWKADDYARAARAWLNPNRYNVQSYLASERLRLSTYDPYTSPWSLSSQYDAYADMGGLAFGAGYAFGGWLGGLSLPELGVGLAALASSHSSCDTQRPVEPPPPPRRVNQTTVKPGTTDARSDGGSVTPGANSGPENGQTQAGTATVTPGTAFTVQGLPLTGPDPGRPVGGGTQDDEGDCRSAFGGGWRQYSPVDVANGSRATGVEACLTKAFIEANKGTGTKVSGSNAVTPPAYAWAAGYAYELGNGPARLWRNACHLLASSLGGEGTIYENLATCSRTANSTRMDLRGPEHHTKNMAGYEKDVRDALKNDNVVVHYRVTPDYDGSRVVPTDFHMQATEYTPGVGTVTLFDDYVPNDMYSLKGGGWRNMGKDAPTEWEP